MKISVVILVISHKHGTDYSLHFTAQEAWDALHGFVVTWWNTEEMGFIPSDDQTAVDEYFEYHLGNEWYEMPIRTLDISGSRTKLKTLGEEEIR
jgi:hypothetical protein